MEEYFKTHSSDLIYGAVIILAVAVLYLLTSLLHKWLLKRRLNKFARLNTTPINLVKRVVNTLWIVLGLIALTFIFVEEEEFAAMNEHFKLVLYLGFVAIITIVAATSSNMWFTRSIRRKTQTGDDPTNFKFLRYVSVYGIYITGALFGLLAIPSLHGVAQTILGGAGVIALIVGVSSQEALSNLVGGLFIISFKPFKVGDVIEISDTMIGTVTDITLRHTVIRNFKNRMIVIPNSIINKEKLVNYDLGEQKCCEYVEMSISYDSNVDLAKTIMQEECEKHPLIYDNRTELEKQDGIPMVKVALVQFDDSSVKLRAWAWAQTFGDSIALKRDVFESIKKRFDTKGIEIPFPYRTIVVKNKEGSK